MRRHIPIVVGVALASWPNLVFAQSEPSSSGERSAPTVMERLSSPTSVQEELNEDRIDLHRSSLDRWDAWKEDLKERTGFEFTFEYNSLLQGYSDAGTGDDFAAGGIARLSGRWTVLNRDEENYGALVYRVDHRHRYTALSPQDAGITAGSALPTATLFSDRQWGLVNLHWTQAIFGGNAGYAIGWFPADDYFHAYASANPLTAFSNLAFSVGGEFALPDSGLGAAAVGMLSEQIYAKGGVHDANGNSGNPNADVFGDWELYKNLEIGWTTGKDRVFLDNFHLGIWHTDARTMAGTPEDWGIVGNASWYFNESRIAPFLRGGWSDSGAALMESQVSAGVARNLRERDAAGVGVSWGRPSAPGTRDQWTTEIFYRIQMGNLAITPNVQMIADPAFNPAENVLWIGGVRGRIVF